MDLSIHLTPDDDHLYRTFPVRPIRRGFFYICRMQTITEQELLARYDKPVPRYTSYPTVPFWKEGLDGQAWQQAFGDAFREHNEKEGISLYLHLPFCESLCTYCGCNKKITTNHDVESGYMNAILKEWRMYRDIMGSAPILRELHLGGGTPTFFHPDNVDRKSVV